MEEEFLKGLRPGNESYEHFILKQVAKKWLYDKGVRYIGTEVFIRSDKETSYGKKDTVDVVGVDYKITRFYEPELKRLLDRWTKEDGLDIVLSEMLYDYPESIQDFLIEGENHQKELLMRLIEKEGYTVEGFVKKVRRIRETFKLYTVEAKASVQDFRNGFSVAGDYSYVIAPLGVIDRDIVPKGIGLIEVDIDLLKDGGDYRRAVQQTKRVGQDIDSKYIGNGGKVNKVYRKHDIRKVMDTIAKRNVNENHYWNPHLR